MASYARWSLKTRIAVWATVAMAAVVASGTSVVLWRLHDDTLRNLTDAQAQLIDNLSTDLDEKIADRRRAIAMTAAVLGPMELRHPTELAGHLASRPVLQHLFDSLFVTDAKGTVLFDAPAFPGRVGLSVSDRDYFVAALRDGTTVISKPLNARVSSEPAITIAAPLRSRAGETRGVLAGVIYLNRSNFLTAVGSVRIGTTGYAALIAEGDPPIIVMHAQRERILSPISPMSMSPHVERALKGHDGTARETNSRGLDALFSFRKLHDAPWLLMTAYPVAEAYEPLRSLQRQIVLLGGVMLLLGGALIWLLVDRLLLPLDRLRQAMVDARGRAEPTQIDLGDLPQEVFVIVRAYNALMAQEHGLTTELRTSRQQLRLITDNVPALISYIDADLRYQFVNAPSARESGHRPEELIGRFVSEIRTEPFWEVMRPNLDRALAGERVRFEGSGMASGRLVHYQATYIPDVDADGRVRGIFALTMNITHRKTAELRQAQSEERVRNIITHASDAFASVGEDGILTEWNRQAEITFGWSRDEALGRSLEELVLAPESFEAHREAMASLKGPGRKPNARIEVACVRRDGTPVPVEMSIALVKDGDGRIAHTFMRDIGERRAAEEAIAASEKRLRDITNNTPALIAYFDREERCRFANDTALKMRGVLFSELEGGSFRMAAGDDAYVQQVDAIRRVLAGEQNSVEGTVTRNGMPLHYQSHFVPDVGERGEVRGFYLMTFNITKLKNIEAERAEGEQRLRTITNNMPVLIAYIDHHERVQFLNETFREWLGIDPQLSVGKPFSDIVSRRFYTGHLNEMRTALGGQRVSFDFERTSDGHTRVMNAVYVPDAGADGQVAGVYMLATDVTMLKQVEQRLSEQARIDPLTLLPNRRAFDERLSDAVGRCHRNGSPIALIYLDIDHFKQINDTYGHTVGDSVLVEFARRLQTCVRGTDTVARLAGDEFVVILEGIKSGDEAELVTRKIGDAVRVPFMLAELMLQVTSSQGIAYLEGEDATPAEVVSKADAALYEAKRSGRNRYSMVRW